MGNVELVRSIYENAGTSFDLDRVRTHNGFVPLTYAAYTNRPEVVSYLSLRVRDLNPVDPLGHTALSRCLINNHFEAALKLVSRGADLNVQNLDGRTALTLCVIDENQRAVRFLLERDANPHLPDYKGLDSCDYAKDKPFFGQFPAFIFCPRVKKKVVVE